MKLPIKEKYFNQIKRKLKTIEFRDAHITFVCEETGEQLRKEITGVQLSKRHGIFPDVLKDDIIVQFSLGDSLNPKEVKK